MKALFTALCICLAAWPAQARLPRLKRPAHPVETEGDSIALPWSKAVAFSGYDKTIDSYRETFFVTNRMGSDTVVTAIDLNITYTDTEGRMLHKASHRVKVDIPPGETRSTAVKTWDKNHVFRYYLSPAPSRRQSSVYKVKISASALWILTENK